MFRGSDLSHFWAIREHEKDMKSFSQGHIQHCQIKHTDKVDFNSCWRRSTKKIGYHILITGKMAGSFCKKNFFSNVHHFYQLNWQSFGLSKIIRMVNFFQLIFDQIGSSYRQPMGRVSDERRAFALNSFSRTIEPALVIRLRFLADLELLEMVMR